MKCESCGLDAAIVGTRMEVRGDASADEQTEVYTVLSFVCRNKRCAKHGQEVGQEQVRVFPNA